MNNKKTVIGISMGDPSGIGMEVILKTLNHDFVYDYCTPVLYGSTKVFSDVKNKIDGETLSYNLIKKIDEAQDGKLNLISTSNEPFEYTLGQPSKSSGKQALLAIDRMLKDVSEGKLQVIVTAPVDKNTINGNIAFNGHTGYIAKHLGVKNHLMILFNDELRVGLVTEHIPISEITKTITKELIVAKAQTFIDALRNDFGIIKPKIAVLGLNPHAGDGGAIGKEEESIIMPAIESFSANDNAFVFGPYSADGLWGSKNLMRFDGVLAMYHDQGLAPFKALAFNEGVNFTAGLPIIRTSPDHGTAYNIADRFEASPSSFSASLFSALKLYATRKELEELKANFLPFSELKRERFRLETRDLDNM
ncbi:MAG: 4-hydroxythreonine-4-phosphate dehydrogenase PdxA [Bacteroidetes bacterium]|nr:4-hydroxythreonine-4-phosphate dehydrogenase PdxA [Bacteroidota bacterium]